MSKEVALNERRAALQAFAADVDAVAKAGASALSTANELAREIVVATALVDMKRLLTDEVMAPIMALMNTDLGFRTDRDPAIPHWKTGVRPEPYDVATVRNCFMESRLRGLRSVGNEWNIIAGRLYVAKAGLRRLVTEFPGLSRLRESYGVPKQQGDTTVVPCSATWLLHGVEDEITAEIAVRVNAAMGTDAVIGKAERKLLKRILDRLNGFGTQDGDIEDIEATVLPQIQPPARIGRPPKVIVEQPAAPKPAPAPADDELPMDEPEPPKVKAEPVEPPKKAPENAPAVPGVQLGQVLAAAGYTLADVLAVDMLAGHFDGEDGRPTVDLIRDWDFIPAKTALAFLGRDEKATGVINAIRMHKSMTAAARN